VTCGQKYEYVGILLNAKGAKASGRTASHRTVYMTAGNSLVILVVAAHHRMRTVTNFFLVNLALSDLCVGIFCVLPNMSTYLSPFWILGKVSFSIYTITSCHSFRISRYTQ